jgi:hypothetical protein
MGVQVSLIDNKATEHHRQEHNIDKSDENDAKIIWTLFQNGAKLQPITIDNKALQLHDIYHQYCRYKKARVAMENMKKAHIRQYKVGASESMGGVQSSHFVQLAPDLSPYDIAIDTLQAREKSLIKRLESVAKELPLLEMANSESNRIFQPPAIRGLGERIWLGLMITANPTNFKCLSSYLRFCGLTADVIKCHKYNRHARMLYHILAECTLKSHSIEFRAIYDKCKCDLTLKHPDYTKGHIHNASLNRTATFLAKRIFNLNGESNGYVKSASSIQPLD